MQLIVRQRFFWLLAMSAWACFWACSNETNPAPAPAASATTTGPVPPSDTSAQAKLPQNPYAPQSPWPEGHGTYCQQSTAQPSFTRSDEFQIERILFGRDDDGFSPSGTVVSSRYPNGAYVCWGTNAKHIYKVVVDGPTTRVVVADANALGHGLVSGYWVMDQARNTYFLSDWKLLALRDADPADPASDIRLDYVVDLGELRSRRAGLDFLIGMKLLYNGRIVVTTRKGKIGYYHPGQRTLTAVLDLQEDIQNNMAVEEGGVVYVNTNSGTYKFVGDAHGLRQLWYVKTPSSGATPTLLDAGEDRLLVVTTEETPSRLMALWRNDIPADALPVLGADPRVAALHDIQYGAAPAQPSKNSVLAHGSTVLVANWTGLWPRIKANEPGVAAYSWSASSNRFVLQWQNPSLALPNSMQALSTTSQTVYAVGRTVTGRQKTWNFVGLDWQTGRVRFEVPLGTEAYNNLTGSGIQIGWDGDILMMSPRAVFRVKAK